MTLLTFQPSIKPSPGGVESREVGLNEAEFGDGYTLAAPVGLNHIRNVIALRWDGITLAQKTELDAFFVAHGGYLPFLYRPYGFISGLKWTCAEWGSTTSAPISYSATLRQSFNLT